jgi:hypothetical protein
MPILTGRENREAIKVLGNEESVESSFVLGAGDIEQRVEPTDLLSGDV